MPQGVVQVAVVGALNVGGAVVFTAFNEVLSAAFETPDAVAQELAATGDPVRAVAAGVNTAAGAVTAAGTAIADSVVTAVNNVGVAAGQSHSGNTMTLNQKSSATTLATRATVGLPRGSVGTTKRTEHAGQQPLRDVVSTVRQAAHSVMKNVAERPHHAVSSKHET